MENNNCINILLTQSASIYFNEITKDFKIVLNILDINSVAYATYKPLLGTKGFDEIKVTTNQLGKYPDHILGYGAGYLEGYLTRNSILNHYKNLNEKTWGKDKKMPQHLREYFIEHKNYVVSQYTLNPSDNYWNLAYTIYMQFEGLVQAYNDSIELYKIDFADFHTITSMGDLFDLVFYKTNINFDKMTPKEIISFYQKNSHCSALIKYSTESNNIYFGHNTWFYYSSMNRILKEYHFKFSNPLQKTNVILFTSYPGAISSIDDFYITDKDLVIMETTNPFFNSEYYKKYLTPNSLLSWERSMMANFVSDNGRDWVNMFSIQNSGTYNNQYMILDLKQTNRTQNGTLELNENALWIIEQVPGYTESADLTSILKTSGYWASYNTPYFSKIRELSKIDNFLNDKIVIDVFDYNNCTRAKIFKRDQVDINTLEDFKSLIRYNDYKNDEISAGNPMHTISSRGDLDPGPDGVCIGATDAKVGCMSNIKNLTKKTISIVGSPSNEQQPNFNWSNACVNDPKFGLQSEYLFNWFDYTMDTKSNY